MPASDRGPPAHPPPVPHLRERYPRLAGSLPAVRLGTYPTPVEPLTALARAVGLDAGTELYVKRDDLSGEPHGMSKVRKLELYLGEALARGARRVATVGPLGSNHALATTVYGRALGLEVDLRLWPEPVTPRVRDTVLAAVSLGARVELVGVGGDDPLVRAVLGEDAGPGPGPGPAPTPGPEMATGDTYFVPPAGTDPVGAVGYVECALELAAQIGRGEAPRPDLVHVAGGTGGVSAGLAVGLALAGLGGVRVASVRAVSRALLHDARLLILSRRTYERLERLAGGPEGGEPPSGDGGRGALGAPPPGRDAFLVLHEHAGEGYGVPTEEAERARRLFAGEAGLVLDPVYTAKAAAGLLAFAASPGGRGRRHLFLHTYGERDLAPLAAGARAADLPPALAELLGH